MGRRKIPHRAPPSALELDEPTMRGMVERVTERVFAHLASLPSQPLHATAGGRKLAASLREDLPEDGAPLERLLKTLFGRVIPASLNTASPGYLAYIPGGGLFQSAIADFIALTTNRYVGVWLAAPGLVQLEENAIQWLAGMLGFPGGAGGLFTSGGSLANLIAIVAARHDRLPPAFQIGTIYTSDQAHHSVSKAASIAGFLTERVRGLPADGRQRLDPAAVEAAIVADRAAGLAPCCIVAAAGTTNTGAVDDLEALADVAARHDVWLHVDAAYGGFFALTERGREAMRGIGRAHSVTLDPHKGMFLPYGTGCLVVRDPKTLARAHAAPASYLPAMQGDPERPDFCELGPELSREARGLRVWLPLKLHGARAFREALDEKLDLAAYAAEAIAALPGVTLLEPPTLSLFAFRVAPHAPGEDPDARSRAVMAAINQRQRVLLTGTTVRGRFVIRVCVLSFRTHRDRIDMLVDDVRAAIAETG